MADEAFSPADRLQVSPDLIAARIGERVRSWRQEAGVSEMDLAATLRLSAEDLRRAETGETCFTPEQIVTIGEIFAVNPSRLLGDIL